MSVRWHPRAQAGELPDGSLPDQESNDEAFVLSLQDERVSALINDVQPATTTLASLNVRVPGLPNSVAGTWALWRIGTVSGGRRHNRFAATFRQGDRTFGPAGARIWDELLSREDAELVAGDQPVEVDREGAQTVLRPIYEQMLDEQEKETAAARERAMVSYEARQRAIGRIGLETVRLHRRRKLEEAHANRLAEIASGAKTLPVLELVAAAQVAAA